jgi:N6-adenosine-specific RNA methylase IME4
MRRPNNLEGLWEKEKAQGAFQEMGMDYWLRRTQEVLERVQE